MSESSGGGCGCFSLVFFILFVWAILYGVTFDGKHYELSCSETRGVSFDSASVSE